MINNKEDFNHGIYHIPTKIKLQKKQLVGLKGIGVG